MNELSGWKSSAYKRRLGVGQFEMLISIYYFLSAGHASKMPEIRLIILKENS
jgi:hypothetical protein